MLSWISDTEIPNWNSGAACYFWALLICNNKSTICFCCLFLLYLSKLYSFFNLPQNQWKCQSISQNILNEDLPGVNFINVFCARFLQKSFYCLLLRVWLWTNFRTKNACEKRWWNWYQAAPYHFANLFLHTQSQTENNKKIL